MKVRKIHFVLGWGWDLAKEPPWPPDRKGCSSVHVSEPLGTDEVWVSLLLCISSCYLGKRTETLKRVREQRGRIHTLFSPLL